MAEGQLSQAFSFNLVPTEIKYLKIPFLIFQPPHVILLELPITLVIQFFYSDRVLEGPESF